MWGQVGKTLYHTKRIGIIPTRVGTRKMVRCCCSRTKDHPHACGDKFFVSMGRTQARGSSPRVWGQERHTPLSKMLTRIIPTRVGTSGTTDPNVCSVKDHPHACGDKWSVVLPAVLLLSSSPRVWGQVKYHCCYCLLIGIIPTRVGTSDTV